MKQQTDTTTDDRVNDPSPDSTQTAEISDADRIAELRARVSSLEESLLRARAEAQNIQKRGISERNEAIRYANAELMKMLIPVLEDFERTQAAGDPAVPKSVIEGTRLVYANLLKALADFGLEPIDAQGQTFDPAIHEALSIVPTDQVPPGKVLEQVTRGYRLRDRVLRPARVIVSKAAEANPAGADGQ